MSERPDQKPSEIQQNIFINPPDESGNQRMGEMCITNVALLPPAFFFFFLNEMHL